MKIYLTETKEEVTFGDIIVFDESFTYDYFGTVTSTLEVTLTEDNLQHFIKEGVVYTETDDEVDSININTIRDTILERMAKRYNWDKNRLIRILKTMDEVHPSASVQIILKEIALMLDEKYPGYIGKSESLFVISMGDGNIYPINKNNIKSFRNIAVFRTEEDAKYACTILGDKLTNLFNGK